MRCKYVDASGKASASHGSSGNARRIGVSILWREQSCDQQILSIVRSRSIESRSAASEGQRGGGDGCIGVSILRRQQSAIE